MQNHPKNNEWAEKAVNTLVQLTLKKQKFTVDANQSSD